MQEETIKKLYLMEGFLHKQGRKPLKIYKERFYCLRDNGKYLL
jgi:hypothetical protein